MKRSKRTESIRTVLGLTAGVLLAVIGSYTVQAYQAYSDGCNATGCHGDFRSSTSPKGTVFPAGGENHDMHRDDTAMFTDCELCHSSPDRTPVYTDSSDGIPGTVTGLGCSGCHVGSGLRKHHATKVPAANCYSTATGCHHQASEIAPAENVIRPYYYEAAYTNGYTLAHNPGNTAKVANTNENWSVGDFVGLDNDGNGLADLADYTIGPFRLLSAVPEGSNLRVTWLTAGGRTNTLQAAGNVSGAYTNLSSAIIMTNVGLVTTNYLEVGGAAKGARFYRVKSQYP